MFNYLKNTVITAMLLSIAVTVSAETAAPVYDADNLPPSFDGQPIDGGSQAPSVPSRSFEARPLNLTLEQRLSRLEQTIENLQHSDTSTKLNQIHNELQSLRGQLEEFNHQLQVLQNQQKSMYSDLDRRISKQAAAKTPPALSQEESDPVVQPAPVVKAKKSPVAPKPIMPPHPATPDDTIPQSSPTPAPVASSGTSQPDAAEEQQTYQVAYDLIKAKKYNEAVAALQKMLQKYPSGQFAANAHYWLGELYGLMGKNNESAAEFSNVVSAYPSSPKVSDAQLKLGLIYAAQFKWPEAKAAFKKVISRYPKTASARLASEQLKQIKQAGH